MVTKYLRTAMRGAKYELLEEGGYYGSIPGFEGVWADAVSLEECRDELEEVPRTLPFASGHWQRTSGAHGPRKSGRTRSWLPNTFGPRCAGPNTNCWKKAGDWKSTRLNSSHLVISYAVFCL